TGRSRVQQRPRQVATGCNSGHAQAETASGSATSGKWQLRAPPPRAVEAAQSAAGTCRTRAQAAIVLAAAAQAAATRCGGGDGREEIRG
ncbi:hypothetical protein GW17_00052777, partial [Ensete ventricosum]